MSEIKDNTPIIVGVGQISETVPDDLAKAASHADLAGKAALAALKDARNHSLAKEIDVIAGVKIFADSSPAHQIKTG